MQAQESSQADLEMQFFHSWCFILAVTLCIGQHMSKNIVCKIIKLININKRGQSKYLHHLFNSYSNHILPQNSYIMHSFNSIKIEIADFSGRSAVTPLSVPRFMPDFMQSRASNSRHVATSDGAELLLYLYYTYIMYIHRVRFASTISCTW